MVQPDFILYVGAYLLMGYTGVFITAFRSKKGMPVSGVERFSTMGAVLEA